MLGMGTTPMLGDRGEDEPSRLPRRQRRRRGRAARRLPGPAARPPAPRAPSKETGIAVTTENAVRPFRVDVPQEALDDLRRRIAATRWPEKETVADQSQGVPLATMRGLARYWANGYDWRAVEARLNALPQFVTEIDGLDIHFMHVRSKHDGALPLIVTHGWPGSVIEQLKIIDPLTDPTAHGASASDAFHLVIPSMPGYGFSARPTAPGWGPERMARAWAALMSRLGYTRYVAQGGDVGAAVTDSMAIQALVTYWGAGYDWRACEAKLNALPQFVTEIDGLDIHFIHVKSRTRMRCR